jgi:hypothetical protein
MSEVLYISKCLRLIEQKLNRGSSRDWGAHDYKVIQKLIFDASSIHLSTQTLERLFGRLKRNYNPQGETKNALAVFLGYQDWENFKSQTAISIHEYEELSKLVLDEKVDVKDGYKKEEVDEKKLEPPYIQKGDSKNRARYIVILSVTALCILACAIALVLIKHKSDPIQVSFKAVNPIGVPAYNVEFFHDLSTLEGNNFSVHIPGQKEIPISKSQKYSYHPFMIPGWYKAYLLSDKKIIAKTNVFIKTPGWQGYFTINTKGDKWPIQQGALMTGGRLYTPHTFLPDSMRNNNSSLFLVSYYNIRNFDVDGDNFTFETRFKNDLREGNQLCNDMWFELRGTDGMLRMHFLTMGCTGYVDLTFGEKTLKGSGQNLAQFGLDIHNWNKARLKIINKAVHIYVNDSLIYKTNYLKSVGRIGALEVNSKASGETDYVKFYNSKTQLVYEDHFGDKASD